MLQVLFIALRMSITMVWQVHLLSGSALLRGHDGADAMAIQILVRCGWRVSVHVPLVLSHVAKAALEETTHAMEDRARKWGADEVIFDDGEGLLDDGRGAAVRVLESICTDEDMFDAIVDMIGGREVWGGGRPSAENPWRTPAAQGHRPIHDARRRLAGPHRALRSGPPALRTPCHAHGLRG